MNLQEYIFSKTSPFFLKIKVIPNSKKNQIIWFMEDWNLKIKITWIPFKWEVNKNIISFLSKELSISKSNLQIHSWYISKLKTIKIDF